MSNKVSPLPAVSAPNSHHPFRADSYLGLLQFLFLLTWVVYVIFLGDLVARAGLPKDFVPRLLIIDQLLFAFADIMLGLYADRTQNLLRRLTPVVLVLNLSACLVFAALPAAASLGASALIAAVVAWVITSTVLRAPLYGAIARRNARPEVGTAWALLGMGLASAAAPYLGLALKGVDPMLPLLVSGAALALATLGFGAWESSQPAVPASSVAAKQPGWNGMLLPMLAVLLIGGGFQIHFFLNAASLFRQVADPAMLPWLMPVFWVGFSIAVYPGARLLKSQGSLRVLAVSALFGAGASLACLVARELPLLVGLQAMAGAAWGMSFLSVLNLAGSNGHHGRESTFVGLVFAVLAVTSASRIGFNMANIQLDANTAQSLAAGLWGAGAVLALYLAVMRNPSNQEKTA